MKPKRKAKKLTVFTWKKLSTWLAYFLAHKANFIGNGVFDSIHKIRKADATSVSEALNLVDNGGFWHRSNPVEEDKSGQ